MKNCRPSVLAKIIRARKYHPQLNYQFGELQSGDLRPEGTIEISRWCNHRKRLHIIASRPERTPEGQAHRVAFPRPFRAQIYTVTHSGGYTTG